MKQIGFKHHCKYCPFYKYLSHLEVYVCTSEWDGADETKVVIPDKHCRCRFGKEWFDKNINEKLRHHKNEK